MRRALVKINVEVLVLGIRVRHTGGRRLRRRTSVRNASTMGARVPTATSKAASTALIAIPGHTVPFACIEAVSFQFARGNAAVMQGVLRLVR